MQWNWTRRGYRWTCWTVTRKASCLVRTGKELVKIPSSECASELWEERTSRPRPSPQSVLASRWTPCPTMSSRHVRIAMLSVLAVAMAHCRSSTAYTTSAGKDTNFLPYIKLKQNIRDCKYLTCRNRPDNARQPDMSTLTKYGCFCDVACAIHGDCCPDALFFNMAPPPDDTSCIVTSPPSEYARYGYYMVNKCSKSAGHAPTSCIQKGRHAPGPNYRDVFGIHPITNSVIELTYANRFCIFCGQKLRKRFMRLRKFFLLSEKVTSLPQEIRGNDAVGKKWKLFNVR